MLKYMLMRINVLTADNAVEVLNALQERGILWCEEPLPVQQVDERAKLRAKIAIPIIADDSAFTVAALQREITMNTFDILNIKTARTGFSQSHLMMKAASKTRKRIMVGSQASSLLGCLHAALFAGHSGVDCASECTFFLKTKAIEASDLISDGHD